MRPIDEFSYLKQNKVLIDFGSMTQLYLPIIGGNAFMLYDYLVSFNDEGLKRHKFSEILNHLQFSMRQLEESIAILTAIDLLVLYETTDAYLLRLRSAFGREAFLESPIYRRLLEQKIGDVAVAELDIIIPQGVRNISKKFSEVFTTEDTPRSLPSSSKIQFDLDSFQHLMMRDGLQFKDEKVDVISIYSIADKYNINWFDTYNLAKGTAIQGKISPQRMLAQLEKKSQNQTSAQFDAKEEVIIREAKSDNTIAFLGKIKAPRRAVITRSEEKLLEDLANMNFLDEVINIMVLYTLNKTKSANLNKPYIMKVANDFAYQKISTAEDAIIKMRSFSQQKFKTKADKQQKTNVPKWTEKEFKQVATAEEAAKLEELKRSMLED